MNNLGNINTTQQRPASQATPTAGSSSIAAQQQFSGAVAPQPQFNANILQLLLTLIQQLIQLIGEPGQPELPQDQTLNPDDATRDKLANILGVSADTLKVTDRDGNGQLSAGDLVEGTVKNEAGQDEAVSSELSALALKDINGELGSVLTLDPPGTPPSTLSKERLALNNVVGVQSGATDLSQGSVIETVFDSDNSGRISAGDVVAIRTTGAEPLSLNYVELSADDVKQFENQAYGPELTFSEAELNQLEGAVYANAGKPIHGSLPSLERVFDINRDGRLSAGDLMEFKDNGPTLSPPAPGVELPEVKPIFNYVEITQDEIDEFNAGVVDNEPLPVSVSGGGVNVGIAGFTGGGSTIPNERIVTIEGRHYSVGFLKQQVDDYANSPYADITTGVTGFSQHAWGGVAGSDTYAGAFERYISDTFPNGDPDVPANPSVRYEDATLIVNGQAYIPGQLPAGNVAPGSLIISLNRDSDVETARELVDSFSEVAITTEFSRLNAFVVQVPADYLTQWQSALEDNLPAGASVNLNRAISSNPGTPGFPTPTTE